MVLLVVNYIDGIVGGLGDGLVGGLIRLVTKGIAFLLELLGLDKFAESLVTNVNMAIMGAYEIFRSTVYNHVPIQINF